MTPEENNEKVSNEGQLEEIARGVQKLQEKLCRITDLLYDCIEPKDPHDNNWAEYYDLDDRYEHL